VTDATPFSVDLTTCEAEPIHIPGRVQPHGVLLVLDDPGLVVSQVSANAAELLCTSPADLIGRSLDTLLSPDSLARLAEVASLTDPRPLAPVLLTSRGRQFDGVAHRHAGRLILEMEPSDAAAPGVDPDQLVRFTLLNLRNGLQLPEFCGTVAREVRALTGYDRVMVYRFDPAWNGEVFAEAKRDDLESFLGLHYPASDIPAQARRLYRLNLVRHIPDVTYASAPLLPELDPMTGRPLDLSHAVLRSVSPIHVEYLRNMGVAGTLTISLLKDGNLWGLVACHHYTPLVLPYRKRAACESLGILVSLQLSAKQDAEELRWRVESQIRLGRLVARINGPRNLSETLSAEADDFVGLTQAAGAACVVSGRVEVVGNTPDADAVLRLAGWLRDRGHEEYATTELPAA
jgi:chemotaxis family two-component system sensor kinase Cph1